MKVQQVPGPSPKVESASGSGHYQYTELAQGWQQAGVSAAKKPLLSRKNIRDRLIFCKRYRVWTAEDWGKVISLMNPLSDGLGHPEKSLSGEDKVSATISPVSCQQ